MGQRETTWQVFCKSCGWHSLGRVSCNCHSLTFKASADGSFIFAFFHCLSVIICLECSIYTTYAFNHEVLSLVSISRHQIVHKDIKTHKTNTNWLVFVRWKQFLCNSSDVTHCRCTVMRWYFPSWASQAPFSFNLDLQLFMYILSQVEQSEFWNLWISDMISPTQSPSCKPYSHAMKSSAYEWGGGGRIGESQREGDEVWWGEKSLKGRGQVSVCVRVCVAEEEGDYFSFQSFVVFGIVPWRLPLKLGFCWLSGLAAKCQQAVSKHSDDISMERAWPGLLLVA